MIWMATVSLLYIGAFPALAIAGSINEAQTKPVYQKDGSSWYTGKSSKPEYEEFKKSPCHRKYGGEGKAWVVGEKDDHICRLRYTRQADKKILGKIKKLYDQNQTNPPSQKLKNHELDDRFDEIVQKDDRFGKCPADMKIDWPVHAKIKWKKSSLEVEEITWDCVSIEPMPLKSACGKGNMYKGAKCWKPKCKNDHRYSQELDLCYVCEVGELDISETKNWTDDEKRRLDCRRCVLCRKEMNK